MKDHEIILKMIEEVDLNDTAKLDEIDARVWCLVRGYHFHSIVKDRHGDSLEVIFGFDEHFESKSRYSMIFAFDKYTRSRDALKAIRPEGWTYKNAYHFEYESERPSEFGFVLRNNPKNKIEQYQIVGKTWQNEELAELHAISQAIAYERGKNAP